jgi:hypothetical protein
MKLRALLAFAATLGVAAVLFSSPPKMDLRLAGSSRVEKNGWIHVRLSGTPEQVGLQHGWLLAKEIEDAIAVSRLNLTHEGGRDWNWYRHEAETTFWPKLDEEYRAEMKGIVEGMKAQGAKADLWDLVAHNANIEFGYYTAMLDKSPKSPAPEHCSAFVATGSATRDHRVVIGHNNWSGYLEGSRWNVIFDIRPEHGYRILMDGMPGLIHSGDDFGVNAAGIIITETTISGFHGFDPKGTPEFVRARKAMQYSSSIDDYDRIMRQGNNGGYANAWLVADIKTNEIARLELGLKYVTLERKKDGAFVGANFPINPKLAAEETNFDLTNASLSPNARHIRWEELIPENQGKIDLETGKRFLSDHYDTYEHKANSPSERTLCGHIDLSPRGSLPWAKPCGPFGTVQNKITTAALAQRMEMEAAIGHACGIDFKAAAHFARHHDYDWQKPLLRDLPSRPWTRFSAPAEAPVSRLER